jgi:hypothetical protein
MWGRRTARTLCRRAWALAHLLPLVAACDGCPPVVEPTPKTIVARVRLGPSCGVSCVGYDIGCVTAVETVARNGHGAVVDRGHSCQDVTGRFHTLCDLIQGAEIGLLEDVDIDQPLTLEVHGYHALSVDGGPPPCVSRNARQWLFWGRSPVAFLGDGGANEVEVELECRDGCPCTELGSSVCPASLPPSACVPRSCDKDCTTAGDCFGGALTCPPGGGHCEARPGGLCAPCSSADACESRVCVADTLQEGGRCGLPCPDTACPAPARCVSLTSGRWRLLD